MGKTKRISLVTEVADRLIETIATRYTPGSKIPIESELADEYSVSRTTIREAIKLLCARNILEIRRGDGTYVSEKPGMSDDPLGIRFMDRSMCLRDLQEFSLLVQPVFVSLATSRIEKRELMHLRQTHKEFEEKYKELILKSETVDDKSIIELRLLDTEFHSEILCACRNEIVDRVGSIISHPENLETIEYQRHIIKSSFKYHEMILDAIAEKNAFAAQQFMALHISENIKQG